MDERGAQKKAHDLQAEILHLKQICGDDPELIADMVEGETRLDEFVGKMLALIGEDETHIEALKAYQKTITARKDRLTARAGRLRTLLASVVNDVPERKFSHPLAAISVSKIDPKPIIEDEAAIPSEFWKERDPVLDTPLIRKTLLGREAALADLANVLTPEEREARLGQINEEFPDIPGASLDNGDISISIRRT